jgi:hypothetical protein
MSMELFGRIVGFTCPPDVVDRLRNPQATILPFFNPQCCAIGGRMTMKRISLLFVALALLAIPIAASAQTQYTTSTTSGTVSVVHNGNTDIIFENAGTSNLKMQQLTDFSNFAASHPDIASRLSRQPQLVANEQFVSSHPELSQFIAAHPDFQSDFGANPGNYLHLAPGVERRVESQSSY